MKRSLYCGLGAMLEVIDTSIVNVALTDIQGNLRGHGERSRLVVIWLCDRECRLFHVGLLLGISLQNLLGYFHDWFFNFGL
jgi:hypothetical protein